MVQAQHITITQKKDNRVLIEDFSFVVNDGEKGVGDSRIYLSRKNRIIFQTEDHSVINEMAKIRTLRADDYEKYASIVTQALMGDERALMPGYDSFLLEKGDMFLLCTDGIHKEMNIDDILYENDEEKLKAELDGRRRNISDNYTFIKVTI